MSRLDNRKPQALLPTHIVDARINACKACEHYDGTVCSRLNSAMLIRARLAFTECPLNKWHQRLTLQDKREAFAFLNSILGRDVLTTEQFSTLWQWVDKATGGKNDPKKCDACIEAVVDDFRMELKEYLRSQ